MEGDEGRDGTSQGESYRGLRTGGRNLEEGGDQSGLRGHRSAGAGRQEGGRSWEDAPAARLTPQRRRQRELTQHPGGRMVAGVAARPQRRLHMNGDGNPAETGGPPLEFGAASTDPPPGLVELWLLLLLQLLRLRRLRRRV